MLEDHPVLALRHAFQEAHHFLEALDPLRVNAMHVLGGDPQWAGRASRQPVGRLG